MVVIVFGLPGSGKSYFASRLASKIKADYISSDRLRKGLIQKRTYSDREKRFVYEEMLKKRDDAQRQHNNLVLDATFYKNELRDLFKKEDQDKSQVIFIEIQADENLISRRLERERADSEANWNVYKLVKQQWEPMKENHLILESTDENIEHMLEKAMDYLKKENDN